MIPGYNSLAISRKPKNPPNNGRILKNGGETRNRTRDTRIFSALLYQLSYLAVRGIGRGSIRRVVVNRFLSVFEQVAQVGELQFGRHRVAGFENIGQQSAFRFL